MDDLFVDAYAISTGLKQRIPRHWLDDPVLGRDFRKTPSQRELDGELPARPAGDATAGEIEGFAEAAGIDLSGAEGNADKLVAIEEAFGPAPVQAGLVEVDVDPVAADPLAPELVAFVDTPAPIVETAVEDYSGDDWTFQALKDEIDKRNDGREDDAHLSKGGSADDLRARLVEDDVAQAEPAAGDTTGDTTDETSTDTSTGDTESPEETPAAGDKEN